MFFQDITYVAALTAGIFSFFSPCILPMIPAYIMFITGTSFEEDVALNRKVALLRTLMFVLGFTIIFMIMGISASFVGKLFIRHKFIFTKISGLIIIYFGLVLLDIIKSPFKSGGIRMPKGLGGNLGAFVMGVAFAAGWTPCFGQVLAGILVMAGASSTITQGMLLLLVYSIGMGIPFVLTALFINGFMRSFHHVERIVPVVQKVGGIIMVVFGILVFFDQVMWITKWLI